MHITFEYNSRVVHLSRFVVISNLNLIYIRAAAPPSSCIDFFLYNTRRAFLFIPVPDWSGIFLIGLCITNKHYKRPHLISMIFKFFFFKSLIANKELLIITFTLIIRINGIPCHIVYFHSKIFRRCFVVHNLLMKNSYRIRARRRCFAYANLVLPVI